MGRKCQISKSHMAFQFSGWLFSFVRNASISHVLGMDLCDSFSKSSLSPLTMEGRKQWGGTLQGAEGKKKHCQFNILYPQQLLIRAEDAGKQVQVDERRVSSCNKTWEPPETEPSGHRPSSALLLTGCAILFFNFESQTLLLIFLQALSTSCTFLVLSLCHHRCSFWDPCSS